MRKGGQSQVRYPNVCLPSRCSVRFHYEEGIEGLGDSSSIWDGISGDRGRPEIGRVDMEV